jgi:hypothetical protein
MPLMERASAMVPCAALFAAGLEAQGIKTVPSIPSVADSVVTGACSDYRAALAPHEDGEVPWREPERHGMCGESHSGAAARALGAKVKALPQDTAVREQRLWMQAEPAVDH